MNEQHRDLTESLFCKPKPYCGQVPTFEAFDLGDLNFMIRILWLDCDIALWRTFFSEAQIQLQQVG